jgi:tRNA threonylcarbamoyladenosine biosynthesis protein TsaB
LQVECFPEVWPRNCPIIPFVLILALDTSSPAGSLAILRDQKVIGEISTWTEETYSSRMFRHLKFLQRELSLEPKNFDLFAVAAGPGSFTGLRVGLAAAKGWAEVFNKPIVGISALEAVAAQAHSIAGMLVPVLDARRGQIYFGFYERDGDVLAQQAEERVGTPEEFIHTLAERPEKQKVTIVTPSPELFSSFQSEIEKIDSVSNIEQVSTVLAPLVGQLGFDRAQRGQLSDSLTLDANYVRRSDAELHWKGP